MRRAVLLALLVVAPLLAGCQAKDKPVPIEVAPGQIVTVTEAPKPSNGIVSGIVGDDALYPLANVTVYVVGLGLNTSTDNNGRFAIVNVPPGIYLLEGEKKDHATTQTTVDVRPGEVAKAVLLMARLPPSDPYHTTVQQEARMEFDSSGLGLFGNGSTSLEVPLDPANPRTVVLEATWDGTIVSTDTSQPFEFHLDDALGKEITAGPAPNPFSLHVDARILPPRHPRLTYTMEPKTPDTTVVQATGHLYATVFYNQEAPVGWSILNGDT